MTENNTSQIVNELAPRDGVLRVRCVGHATGRPVKSDGFIITLNDRVWLIDGGMRGNYDAYERLLDLREAWLGRKNRANDCEECKLHITWLISHFHVDHVQETIAYILKSPYIAVDEIYIPPETVTDPSLEKNEDGYYRPMIYGALEKYQPYACVHRLNYGHDGVVRIEADGMTLDILPPDSDWGTPEKLELISEIHFKGSSAGHHPEIKTMNSNTVWHLFRYAGRSLLFTGDSNKNDAGRSDESVDVMSAIYADMIGDRIDAVKWPHHGIARDAAAGFIHSLDPEYILISTAETETASAEYSRLYPDAKTEYVRIGNEDETFYITPDGNLSVAGGSDVFADFAAKEGV